MQILTTDTCSTGVGVTADGLDPVQVLVSNQVDWILCRCWCQIGWTGSCTGVGVKSGGLDLQQGIRSGGLDLIQVWVSNLVDWILYCCGYQIRWTGSEKCVAIKI